MVLSFGGINDSKMVIIVDGEVGVGVRDTGTRGVDSKKELTGGH